MSSTKQHPQTHIVPSQSTYKGKFTRSWGQLPPEIIRQIATHYLLDVSATGYCPNTWEARDMWPGRLVYTAMRDALELERLMAICPTWASALEHHLYWQQACAVIDPNDLYAHHMYIRTTPPQSATSNTPTPTIHRIPPYRHFRHLTNTSCLVCRINHPYQNTGLGFAKRTVHIPWMGAIFTCRDHRRPTFCGICLREAPPLETDSDYNLVCCADNEDDETWPGVESTCRMCRTEFLWLRVQNIPADREAVGGSRFAPADWEIRQSVEAFLELGEGTISDVISLARDKHWLRQNTKLSDMLSQALAASRYAARAESLEGAGGGVAGTGNTGAVVGYSSEDEFSEEDEDDAELMSLTEDAGGVRDIAIADWARNRILDGFWISPADQWYGHVVPGYRPDLVEARHPCPWNRGAIYDGALEEGEAHSPSETGHGGATEIRHPRPKTIKAEFPPSFALCEQVYRAYQRQMRDILHPAMSNLVRRVVMESSADDVDPTLRVARMSLDEVAKELRDEAVWYDGIDWLERRANREKEERESNPRTACTMTAGGEGRNGEDDDSSISSRSDASSHTTSPVLSTTTLQTTPSPPPSGDTPTSSSSAKDDESETSSPVATRMGMVYPIPLQPVLKAPKLIHPIPYIPETFAHLPYYSLEAVRLAWREACAPLYQCRCTICERAILKANIDAGHSAPSQTVPSSTATTNSNTTTNPPVVPTSETPRPQIQIQIHQETKTVPTPTVNENGKAESPVLIRLEEALRDDNDVSVDASCREEEVDDNGSDSIIDGSSDEIEEEADLELADTETLRHARVGGGKRPGQRLPLPRTSTILKQFNFGLPGVIGKKRSSNELDADVETNGYPVTEVESYVREEGRGVRTRSGSPPKRVKVDGSFSDPSTPPPSSNTTSTTPSVAGATPTAAKMPLAAVKGFQSPARLRKRSSEELEDDDGAGGERLGSNGGGGGREKNQGKKRQRSDDSLITAAGDNVVLPGGFVINPPVIVSTNGKR